MVDQKFMNAVSVGFMPLAMPTPIFDENKQITGFEFSGQELLELSVVPVPANPAALQLARDLKIPDDHMRELFLDPTEIKLTSEKSTTSRIGLPSLGKAAAI